MAYQVPLLVRVQHAWRGSCVASARLMLRMQHARHSPWRHAAPGALHGAGAAWRAPRGAPRGAPGTRRGAWSAASSCPPVTPRAFRVDPHDNPRGGSPAPSSPGTTVSARPGPIWSSAARAAPARHPPPGPPATSTAPKRSHYRARPPTLHVPCTSPARPCTSLHVPCTPTRTRRRCGAAAGLQPTPSRGMSRGMSRRV
jgi:hypothetical protein